MEQKVVKLNLGKLIAIIVVVALIAIAATMLVQGTYFKGQLIETDRLADETLVTKEATEMMRVLEPVDTKEALVAEPLAEKILVDTQETTVVQPIDSKEAISIQPLAEKELVDYSMKTLVDPSVELEVEKLIKEYETDLSLLELEIDQFQIDTVTKHSVNLENSIAAIAKKYDPNVFVDIVKKFNTAIANGQEFDAAFSEYFTKGMTLTNLGIDKFNDKLNTEFETIKKDFAATVEKDLAAKDFSIEFDAILKDFSAGLEILKKEASTTDLEVLRNFESGVLKIESSLVTADKLSVSEFETLLPAYQKEVDIFLVDFGF